MAGLRRRSCACGGQWLRMNWGLRRGTFRPMIAAYIRVSSASQSLDTQRDAIIRGSQLRGQTIDVWFEDTVSGASSERAGLHDFLGGAAKGMYDFVYIYRFDRISRAGILHSFRVLEKIRETGAKIVSVADPFQVDGPFGDLVLAILAYVAQQERETLRLRQESARKRLESEGREWGRPSSTSLLQRQLICERATKGESCRKIAMALKIPKSTVARVIQELRVGGVLSQNHPEDCPPTKRVPKPKSGIDRGTSQ